MTSQSEEKVEFGFLDHHVGFQVHLSRRAIWHNFRSERRQAKGKPPSGYYTALVVIGLNPGIAPKRLAMALYLDPQATASILDRLEQDGFAIRTRSSTDKRRVELYLSEQGQNEMGRVEKRSSGQEARLSQSLSSTESKTLVDLLAKLRTGLASGRD